MSVDERASDIAPDDATGITCRGCGAAVLETVAETEHDDGSVHVDVSCPACFAGGRQIVNPAGPRAIREVGAALDGQRVMTDGGVSGDGIDRDGATPNEELCELLKRLRRKNTGHTASFEDGLHFAADQLEEVMQYAEQTDTSRTGGDQA